MYCLVSMIPRARRAMPTVVALIRQVIRSVVRHSLVPAVKGLRTSRQERCSARERNLRRHDIPLACLSWICEQASASGI